MKVIANIGINWWDGEKSDKRAHALVDEAIKAGVAAICIPFFRANVFRDKEKIRQTRKFEIKEELLYDLVEKAQTNKVSAYVSPRHPEEIQYLESIGVSGYHIQNGDIQHIPLLESVSELFKPVFLSTGFSTFDEINTAILTILGEDIPEDAELILMHSTGGMPTPMQDACLRRILDLAQDFFPLYVGFESFVSMTFLDYVSLAYKPAFIMRRLDLEDKNGVEAEYSLTPSQMNGLVTVAHAMEEVLAPVVDQNGFTKTDFDARKRLLRCKESDFLIPPSE